MNSLTRVIPFAGAFLLTGAMVGCGDDDGSNDPIDGGGIDAKVVDAGAVDACQGGHGEGCVENPFQLPEHGEFRLELFQDGPSGEGNDTRLAAQAFFFTGQNPDIRPIGGKPIEIDADLAALGYACADYRDGNFFENGGTAEAQAIADSRTYLDVGESATLTNVNDESEVITLNKFESSDDPEAATDISAVVVHDILYQADIDTEVTLGTQYRPAVAGSSSYIRLDLGFGIANFTFAFPLADEAGVGDPKIYIPSKFEITTPSTDDWYAPAGLTFTKGQNFTINYTIAEPEDVGTTHPTILPFIGFIKNREVQAYCFRVTPDVRDTGEFIVPHQVFEIIDADPAANEEGSYVEFGRFTHAAWEAQNLTQPGRLDLLGVNCQLSPDWEVVDAPVQ